MVNSHLKMVPPQQKNKVFLVVIPIVTLANLSPVTISTPKSVVFFRPRLTWWNKTHRHDRLEKLGSFDPFRLPFSFPVFDGKVDEGSQKTPKKCTTRRFFVLFRPNFGVESESSFFSRLQNLKKHRISDIVSPKQKLWEALHNWFFPNNLPIPHPLGNPRSFRPGLSRRGGRVCPAEWCGNRKVDWWWLTPHKLNMIFAENRRAPGSLEIRNLENNPFFGGRAVKLWEGMLFSFFLFWESSGGVYCLNIWYRFVNDIDVISQ